MTLNDFLNHCTVCGGNWTAMFLTGLKEVAPDIYNAMPDRNYSFDEVVFIVNHLCEDRPHLRYNISLGHVIEFGTDGNFHFRDATEEEMAMTTEEFELKYNGIDMRKSEIETVKRSANNSSNGVRQMNLDS